MTPETNIQGIQGSQYRADMLSIVPSAEQLPSEVLHFPHQLDNPTARQRILDNDADPEAVVKVYDSEGRWALRGEPGTYPNLWQTSPALVQRALVEELRPVYNLVDYNLRGEKWPHGYNRHDLEHHVLPVYEQSSFLLDQAGYRYDSTVKRINAVAAIGHDAGNVSDRRGHAGESPVIVATVVPDVLTDPEQWQVAEQAMQLHDEKKLMHFLNSLQEGQLTPEQQIHVLHSLGPVLSALVLADKGGTSIDRSRVNLWARNPNTVNNDGHMWPNFLAKGLPFEISKDRTQLKSIVEYNPNISGEEQDDFYEISRERSNHPGYRALVPNDVHQLYRNGNVSIRHFSAWQNKLMSIYLERSKLSALCAKALFPQLRKFVLEFRDERGTRSRGRGVIQEEIYYDGYLAEQFAELDVVYKSKEERRPQVYNQTEFTLPSTS